MMFRAAGFMFIAMVITAESSWAACTHYASPGGTGDGLSQSTPFKIQNFWAIATPGKTLCLHKGTYQGDAGMIHPPQNFGGTPSAPITIRALNDGDALLDGQFARDPVYLYYNNWLTIEGINAKSGRGGIVRVWNSSHITIRRAVFWDTDISRETYTVLTWNSPYTLFEDIGMFGTATIHYHHFGSSSPATCRRCWARWEGTISGSNGSTTFHLNYGGSSGLTLENGLGTWSGESMPQDYDMTDGNTGAVIGPHFSNHQAPTTGNTSPRAIFRIRGGDTMSCIHLRVLGSLAYVKQTDRFSPSNLVRAPGSIGFGVECVEIKDMLVFISSLNPAFNNVRGLELLDQFPFTPNDLYLSRVTSVRGSRGDLISSNWQKQNFSAGSLLSILPNPWTNTGTGANLCNRYVNGVRTNEPLWPWPMNDRIKAATAMADSYNGPCPNCVGGRAPRIPTDVTADIEKLLGAIPSQCRTTASADSVVPTVTITSPANGSIVVRTSNL
jgi:hypothetical protein